MPSYMLIARYLFLFILTSSFTLYGQIKEKPAYDLHVPFSMSPAADHIFLTEDEKQRLHPVFHDIVLNYRTGGPTIGSRKFNSMPLVVHINAQEEVLYDAIIYSDDPASLRNHGIPVNGIIGNIGTARLTQEQLSLISGLSTVNYVKPPDQRYPTMEISAYETRAHYLNYGYIDDTPYTGEGAIVVVFDTGVDWKHIDFCEPDDSTRTRILYLWDVTLEAEGGEKPFGEELGWSSPYGVEYTKEDIEAALAGTKTVRSLDHQGHGTHVLGTAAGSGTRYRGIAPDSDIIIVNAYNLGFSNSDIINGLIYAQKRASDLGKPVVVNLSLGGHRGPHDGSRPDEQVIDYLSQNPGYVVVAAAGNNGDELIHVEGKGDPNAESKITVTVPEHEPWGSDDGFRVWVWFEDNAHVTATVKTPAGIDLDFLPDTETHLPDGTEGYIYVWNMIDHISTKRNILLYVGNFNDNKAAEGTWEMTFSGTGSWLNHDVSFSRGGIGTNRADMHTVASRFDEEDLSIYYGNSISEVNIVVRSGGGNDVTLLLWEGGSEAGPDSLIYEKQISDEIIYNEWTVHTLSDPVQLKAGKEYWIGYRINATGGYPLGRDSGPAVPGKGNMILVSGMWQQLTDLNSDLNYNWNIRGKLDQTHPSDDFVSSYDGWLLTGNVGDKKVTLENADNNKTIGMPGTAHRALTVGAYVTKNNWMNYEGNILASNELPHSFASFSSRGPTADGRLKPEITAPGSAIASALAKDSETERSSDTYILHGGRHVLLQGTSMSAPHVAGAVALLLGINPMLTADDIKNLLTSTAVTDIYTGSVPNNVWGYGKMDIFSAVAQELGSSITFDRENLVYHNNMDSPFILTGQDKVALKFSPTIDGFVSGLFVNITDIIPEEGALHIDFYSDNDGEPGVPLYDPIACGLSDIHDQYFNYFNLSESGVEVEAGIDYYIVLSLTDPSSSLSLLFDNGDNSTLRSMVYQNNAWNIFQSDGSSREFLIQIEVTSLNDVTSVAGVTEIPIEYVLCQNYPNPFNPSTTIRYALPGRDNVTVIVYNMLGQEVAKLSDQEIEAGYHEITFDASHLPSGVYIYRLQAGEYVESRKMLYLK